MTLNYVLNIIQIIIAVILTASILIQNREGGLSQVFGGEGAIYQTKRGAEKFIFIFTIILSTVFIGLALIRLFIR